MMLYSRDQICVILPVTRQLFQSAKWFFSFLLLLLLLRISFSSLTYAQLNSDRPTNSMSGHRCNELCLLLFSNASSIALRVWQRWSTSAFIFKSFLFAFPVSTGWTCPRTKASNSWRRSCSLPLRKLKDLAKSRGRSLPSFPSLPPSPRRCLFSQVKQTKKKLHR